MLITANETLSRWSGTFLSFKPVIRAAIISVFLMYFLGKASHIETMEYTSIYSGVFDLISIFTGFLATFYVFVVTKGNRFLQKIRKTSTFVMMINLLKFTIFWSILMVAFSYLLMVASPKNLMINQPIFWLVMFWVFNVTLIGVNFWRCVHQFAIITDINVDNEDNK